MQSREEKQIKTSEEKTKVTLIRSISAKTVSALSDLQEIAQEGELIGIAFVGIKRGRKPITGWVGAAGNNPFLTLGFVNVSIKGCSIMPRKWGIKLGLFAQG